MANRVRTHTRRMASGGTARVKQHSRTGRPRKSLVSPGHAWGLFKRAAKASKRKKTALAITLGVLGAGELGAWFTLRTGGVILCTAGFLAVGAGTAAWAMSGKQA